VSLPFESRATPGQLTEMASFRTANVRTPANARQLSSRQQPGPEVDAESECLLPEDERVRGYRPSSRSRFP